MSICLVIYVILTIVNIYKLQIYDVIICIISANKHKATVGMMTVGLCDYLYYFSQ